jgi:hypothetical protein
MCSGSVQDRRVPVHVDSGDRGRALLQPNDDQIRLPALRLLWNRSDRRTLHGLLGQRTRPPVWRGEVDDRRLVMAVSYALNLAGFVLILLSGYMVSYPLLLAGHILAG